MSKVRVAIAGVGNCATSLVQGVEFYRNAPVDEKIPGLMHTQLGEYHVGDVEFVAAFDVDAAKVGSDLADALKSQVGATITHRVMGKLFEDHGVRLDRTMQLNVVGNMNFKNMLDRQRLESKKVSKTQAATSNLHHFSFLTTRLQPN